MSTVLQSLLNSLQLLIAISLLVVCSFFLVRDVRRMWRERRNEPQGFEVLPPPAQKEDSLHN
jgi:hypothetical protein